MSYVKEKRMVYLNNFTFPNEDMEFDFFMEVKRTCYDSFYPFKILSAHGLERIDFEPVTILYGGNGSGKCKSDTDGVLYYELDKNFSTNGASGAPIVNEKGEVVGIHISSDGNGLYAGNSATSFNDMIKKSFK